MSTAHDKPSVFRVGGIALAFDKPTICRRRCGRQSLLQRHPYGRAFAAGQCALSIDHDLQAELKCTVMADFAAHGDDLAFLSDPLPDDEFGWGLLAAFGAAAVEGCSASLTP